MPFFQGATDFDITGGNFYDIQGDQNNRHDNHSVNFAGENNRTTFAPNYSRQDNRSFNFRQSHSNVDLQAGFGLGHQNHASGTIPQQYPSPPINHEAYQMHLLALAYANFASQNGTPQPQGLSNPNPPQLMHRPYDNSGNIANFLPSGANQQNGLNSHNRPQQPSPRPQQHQAPYNLQHLAPPQSTPTPHPPSPPRPSWTPGPQRPPVSRPPQPQNPFPSHIPGLAAFTAPSELLADQGPTIPGYGAFMAQQSLFEQRRPSGPPAPPLSTQPPSSPSAPQPPSHTTGTPPSQHVPQSSTSAPAQPTSSVPPPLNASTKPPSTSASHGPPPTNEPTPSDCSSYASDDEDEFEDSAPAQPTPAVSAMANNGYAIAGITTSASGTSTTSNTSTPPLPPQRPQAGSSNVAYGNAQPMTPPAHFVPQPATSSPVTMPQPLISPPLSSVANSPPGPNFQSIQDILTTIPVSNPNSKKKRQSWLPKFGLGKKKQKTGKLAVSP